MKCNCLQDVDAGYVSKTDLDDSVCLLTDEVNFLKSLYDAVRNLYLKILYILYIQYLSLFCILDFVFLLLLCVVLFKKKKELHDLQESMKETSVVVQMDNSRGLNMDQIVADVKSQYEEIAARSREEAESLHKNKVKN